jgi:hypothetical protein
VKPNLPTKKTIPNFTSEPRKTKIHRDTYIKSYICLLASKQVESEQATHPQKKKKTQKNKTMAQTTRSNPSNPSKILPKIVKVAQLPKLVPK